MIEVIKIKLKEFLYSKLSELGGTKHRKKSTKLNQGQAGKGHSLA